MLLGDTERAAVSVAIRAAEQGTDAELVTVLAPRSDRYHDVALVWAAAAALLLGPMALLAPAWLALADVVALQLAVFVALAMLLRLPALLPLIVPAAVLRWRCENMARRQFVALGLHHTRDECGVLVFVSEAEHFVEILADRGIAARVPNERWTAILAEFTAALRRGETAAGFLACIAACGAVLAEVAPPTHARNDLPDHLVVVEVPV